ncbi:RND family transporter, partial [Vibrio vulnificus]|nr:RND family transporter [Vibrio vulnificus]
MESVMNHLQQSTNERTSLLAFSTRFSFWTLIISLIAIVATAMGAKNLYFRGDYNIFFDGSNAQLQAFDEIQTTFAKTDNI